MWNPGPGWHNLVAPSSGWRSAVPFSHLVIDDLLADRSLSAMMEILEDEPVEPYRSDLFAFDATAPEPASAEFRAVRDQFAQRLCPAMSELCGQPLTRVDMRAYAYRPGHYLLPHSDHQRGLGRALAYAYYLPSPDPPLGGELELFACRDQSGQLTEITSAQVIEPRRNRLVVFAVSDLSLHQVREVLGGLRLSLAGWFYP
jgi:Rps23 Pro-64 3,4-dihydroxylase Tpa1-like proline 4-hydroxylase